MVRKRRTVIDIGEDRAKIMFPDDTLVLSSPSAKSMRRILDGNKHHGRIDIVTPWTDQCHVFHVKNKTLKPKLAEKALRTEMLSILKRESLKGLSVHAVLLNRSDGYDDVMAITVPNDHIDKPLKILKKNRLTIGRIIPLPVALAKAAYMACGSSSGIVIDYGKDRTIAMAVKNGWPQSLSIGDIGAQSVIERMKEDHDISDTVAESFRQEYGLVTPPDENLKKLSLSLQAQVLNLVQKAADCAAIARRDSGIDPEWCVCVGGGAMLNGVSELTKQAIGVPNDYTPKMKTQPGDLIGAAAYGGGVRQGRRVKDGEI